MTVFLVILEDRHTDVEVRVFAKEDDAMNAFANIVSSYDYKPGQPDQPIEGWLAHATLSGEGDWVRVERAKVHNGHNPKITLDDSVKLAVGAELIDVKYEKDGVCDCGPEVTLHFNNGQEISVYVHPETGVVVEGD